MAQLTPQVIALSGLANTYISANATDKVKQPTDQRLFLHVKNGSGASINVTIAKQQAAIQDPMAGSVALSDIVVAVPAGSERMIGPFPPAYVDVNGDVNIAYSATSSVTARVFSLARVP